MVDKHQIHDTTNKDIPKKDRVITQALSRFRNVMNMNKTNNAEAVEDLRMLASRGHWPKKVVESRTLQGRPMLVINKLPGFAARIKNESRSNQISVKVVPRGNGATKEVAEIINGLIKSIEVESDADVAYQTALDGAVNCGFGYFRINTCFVEDSPWDQELIIERIKNNFAVALDPMANKHDGSDGRFAFVTEMVEESEYEARFPGKSAPAGLDSDGANSETSFWVEEACFRIGEYWVKIPDKKRIYLLSDKRTVDGDEWDEVVPLLKEREEVVHMAPDPTTGQQVMTPGPAPEGSGFPEDIINKVPEITRERTVNSFKVVQYIIDGEKILEGPNEWAGKYIPIVPIWGEEIVVDGEVHLRGVVRLAKDSQRMYNYFRTAATETVALAPKAPWVGTAEQFENHEDEWDEANRSVASRLTYNHQNGVPPPQRQVVTQTAIGEITEANISSDEMKDTTNIQDASLGAAGNEISGVAIARRQSQSNIVNFTYIDNRRLAIKYAGKIMLDLILRIYDTERVVAIVRPDEEEDLVAINQQVEDKATGNITIINDLSLGKYGVTVTTGPAFQTQRQEAAASMLDFVRTAPETAATVIDLIAEAQDWPNAVKIANRLRKFLPPGIDDEGPPPPQEPSIDDIIKDLKSKSMELGNVKKGMDIVEQRRKMTDEGADFDRLIEVLQKFKTIQEEPNVAPNQGR